MGQVRSLLTLQLLRIPIAALRPSINLAGENAQRWKRFQSFYDGQGSIQKLKSSVLCLRLTDLAMSITAQKQDKVAGRQPTLVRLSKGEVQVRCSWCLHDIFKALSADPALNATVALRALLTTHGHLVSRFDDYRAYPFKLWEMTAQWNPDSYVCAIEAFLDEAPEQLDVGYSQSLQEAALRQGSRAQGISFLLDKERQSELVAILTDLFASSLDVERKHAYDKKHEKNRVLSVAAASRNSILQRYRVGRNATIAKLTAVRKQALKRQKIGASALAVQRNPSWLPRPGGITGDEYRHEGNMQALRGYLDEHRQELQEEAKCLRSDAREILRQRDAPLFPQTNADWLQWMEANHDEFTHLLRTASSDRRSLSQRPGCKFLLAKACFNSRNSKATEFMLLFLDLLQAAKPYTRYACRVTSSASQEQSQFHVAPKACPIQSRLVSFWTWSEQGSRFLCGRAWPMSYFGSINFDQAGVASSFD